VSGFWLLSLPGVLRVLPWAPLAPLDPLGPFEPPSGGTAFMHGHILLRNLHFRTIANGSGSKTAGRAAGQRQRRRLIGISLIYDTCETIWKITD